MPRKPDPFQELADRILDRVLFPALEDNLFPLIDGIFRNVLPQKPPKTPPSSRRKRIRVNPVRERFGANRPLPPGWTSGIPREPTLYDVLQVSRHADREVIRAAYRNLSIRNHPDQNPGNKAAEERFKQIAAAYEILGDAQKRAAYDRSLKA